MTKHYCDLCGKETDKLHNFTSYIEDNSSYHFTRWDCQICKECKDEVKEKCFAPLEKQPLKEKISFLATIKEKLGL